MFRSHNSATRPSDVVGVGRPECGCRLPAPPTAGSVRQLRHWARRYRRAMGHGAGDRAESTAPPPTLPATPSRVVLSHHDLLWFKTSQDEEGRITLGLLECSPGSIGVLVDDNGESLGLRLSRVEAQDLHHTLVTWLAGSTPRTPA